MAADVTKSVRISFNLNANFKQALNNINTTFNSIVNSAEVANLYIKPLTERISSIKTPPDFDKFVNGLRSLASIKAENVTRIQTALDNVAKVKFPDFSAMNPKIEAHAKAVNSLGDAYKKLGEGMRAVDMRRLSNAVASGNAVINNQGQVVSRNRTAFAQYAYAIGSASSGLSVLGSRLYGITRGFSAISRELSASLGIFVSVFGAMFAIKGVVKDLVAFDDAMRRTAAVANASSSELQLMTDAARAMGETTRYTAQEAADGLQVLALAGLNASESVKALPTVLNAAASEGIGLDKAAGVLLATMNSYGMAVEDLTDISDILVATSVNSATSLIQLKESMKQVAPIAASAGIDLAQLSSLIGVLANTGIAGGKAGTVLKNAITRLLSPTRMVNEALVKYDLTTKQLIESNTNATTGQLDFIGVLEQMRSQSIKTGDAMRIFGLIAGSGMVKLLQSSDESIRQLYETLQNAQGTSLKVAYEMESGVGGSLRRLKSMWEELSLSIGDAINDDLVDFFENLTRVIKENKEAITTFVSLLMQTIGVFISLSVSIGELIVSFPELSLAIGLTTIAISSFLVILKAAQITGFTAALSGLLRLNFVGFASQTAVVAAKLMAFNTTLSSINFASFILGFKASITNLAVFGGALYKVIIALSPYIAIVGATVAVIYSLIKAYQDLFPNYEKIANSSANAVKVNQELSRVFEYQRAELKLIADGYKLADKYKTDTASLEERLITLLGNANISLELRIKLLDQFKSKQKTANEVIAELNTILEQASNKNLNETLASQVVLFQNQSKSIDAANKKLDDYRKRRETLINLLKDRPEDEQSFYQAEIEKTNNKINEQIKKVTELESGWRQTNEQLLKQTIPLFVKSGYSVSQFTDTISKLGLEKNKIAELTDKFVALQDLQSKGVDVVKKSNLETQNGIDLQIESMRNLNAEYDNRAEKINQNLKDELSALKAKQTEQGVSEEQANQQQQDLINKNNAIKLRLATEYYDNIKKLYDEAGGDLLDTESELTKEVEKAHRNKQNAFNEYIDNVTDGLSELRKEQAKHNDENKKADDDIAKAKIDSIDKIIDAEKDLNKQIIDSNIKLKNDRIKIEQDLAQELQKISAKRIDIENEKNNNSLSIEENLQDKIRNIRQRSMSEAAKDTDDFNAAEQKLAKGRELANQAAISGNESLLQQGQRLIEQASSLYEGLKSQNQAMNGVEASAEALKDIEEKSSQIKLQNLEKEKQKTIEQAEVEKQAKQRAYDDDVASFKRAYNDKIRATMEAAKQVITAQQAEITNHQLKLDLLEQEIQKTIALKKIELINTNDTTKNIESLKILEQYQQEIDKINAKIKQSELTPTADLEKLKTFDELYKKISSGADLSNTSVQNLTNSTDKLIRKSTEFDKFEYKVKFSDDSIQTLEGDLATIKTKLNEIKSQAEIQVKLPNGNIETIQTNVDKIDETLKTIPPEYVVNVKTFSNIQEINDIKQQTETVLSDIKLKPNTQLFYNDIQNLVSVIESTLGNININSTEKQLGGLEKLIEGVESKVNQANESEIDIKANPEPIEDLKAVMDTVTDKLVKILTEIKGKQELIDLAQQIANLKDKTITITQKIKKVEENQAGGLVGHYANGGNVFRRLSNPFISKGSGNKDDVPAMLMKGEFVQKVSAVRKYGKNFMAKLNAGMIPKYITQMFENGGYVSNLGLNLRNNNGINNMLSLMKSSLYSPIPAYATGGFVNTNSNNYNARIELALGNKTYTVKAQTNVAKELVKEMKKYGRVI